jgi:hypothetical protein
MRAPLLLFVCAFGVLVEMVPSRAFAQDTSTWPPSVAGTGSCPDSNAVESLLAGLLPANAPASSTPAASVQDLGDSYVVGVGDRVKTYSDTGRGCAERARVAAAFISLALVPNAPLAPDTTPPVATPKPKAIPSPPAWKRIDARATYFDAPSAGLLTPGIALGLAAGVGRIGAQVGCGWNAGASISPPNEKGSVLIERFPCSLGGLFRVSSAEAPLEVDASVGAILGVLRATGTGFASSYDSLRLEAGARVAVDATLHLGRRPGDLAPVIGLEATYDPMAYDLVVVPGGVIGQAPSFWAGVSAGVSWSIP